MMSEQNTWYSIEVKTKREAVEAVEFALLESGAEGTELNLLGKKPDEENVSVIGYFQDEPDTDVFHYWLRRALENFDLPSHLTIGGEYRQVENRDWLAEWKKHWKPTETAKFIVAPTWSEVGDTDKTILRIEPGMAFGTGTHETTQLCLQAIEKYYDGGSFFDVGTGTGVLAMAATKMQSKFQVPNSKFQILACDTDSDSVKIAEENAEINGVADRIEFYVGSIEENIVPVDFVAANLTADVIVPLLPLLTVKFNKTLILSGILREQQDWIVSELNKLQNPDFKLSIQTLGEWVSIVIKNA